MKKRFLTIFMALVLAISGLSLFACGGGGGQDVDPEETKEDAVGDPLYVMYYPGGYGSDWIEEFVIEFLAKEKNVAKSQIKKGTDYKLEANEGIGAATTILSKTGKNCPDILISNGIDNQDITKNLIAPLTTGVYDQEVQTSNGKVKISDYMMEESKLSFTRAVKPLAEKEYQWAVPWTTIPLSLAYNETLLKTIVHKDSNGTVCAECVSNGKWIAPPTTFDELLTCFKDITDMNLDNVDAFGWSAKDGTLWFESLIYQWWAQASGIDTFYDFWNLDTADKYKDQGIQTALSMVQQLINKNYVYGNPDSITIKDFQPAFARGEIVFCLTGDFFAKEYASILAENKSKVNAKLMPVPALDEATKQAGGKNYTYMTISQCIYVSKNGSNTNQAKRFLTFINDEEHLLRFTELTGGIRPYGITTKADRQAMKTKVLARKSDWTDYEKSVFDLFFDYDDVLVAFPRDYLRRPGNKSKISVLYTYEGMRSLADLGNLLKKLEVGESVNDLVINNTESLFNSNKLKYNTWKSQDYGDYMNSSVNK